MILGIGIDIVETSRFDQDNASEAFLRKVFTKKEIEECRGIKDAAASFAVKFAIKEAFMKAIGAGIGQEVWFTNIEVLNERSGTPQLTPQKKARYYYETLNANNIHISYSSTSQLAVGVVVLMA